MPLTSFRRLRAIDPACGSGIFLRTLMERQYEISQDSPTTALVEQLLSNTYGIDIDENAAQATRLSLALLYLVLTNSLPDHLLIETADTFQYYRNHPELKGSFDVVLANPPFVSLDTQNSLVRKRVRRAVGKSASGRIDTYLAFLKLGLEMLKPGGYGLFVLPHSFLLSRSAKSLREALSSNAWITCLADLSAIRVFGDFGSYVILLIFQKKPEMTLKAPPALIVKCDDLVGIALEDALDGRHIETAFYNIFSVDQTAFQEPEWSLVPPTLSSIERRLLEMPTLATFLHIRQGIVTGADDVFIIRNEKIPQGEDLVYKPLLADREMRAYAVPTKTTQSVFYPYIGGIKGNRANPKRRFPANMAVSYFS